MTAFALHNLWTYLQGLSLSQSDREWLAGKLVMPKETAEELTAEQLKPYTMEEIRSMMAQAERESAAGLGQDSEEMFRELQEEFAREEQTEMLEAV